MLYPHHLQDLRASGLSDDTIQAAGFYSESSHVKLATLLNRKRWDRKLGSALVIPFKDDGGQVVLVRVKPDNRPQRNGKPGPKYLSPSGSTLRVYVPPGVYDVFDRPTQPLILTEGEKKALKATQDGFPCIALTGVDCWHTPRSSSLLPDLARIAWQGRDVYICFDSDAETNDNVRTNEILLAATLRRHGAAVRIVRLPAGANGEKVGLDDYLVANGPDAFRLLLDAAAEPELPDPNTLKIRANDLDPAQVAEQIVGEMTRDGLSRLRWWRDEFYWWGSGAYRKQSRKEVKARVVLWLNHHTTHLTSRVTNDVMAQLEAQAMLPGSITPPAWLSDPHPWPPSEVLAAKNGLFHLPSIVEGKTPWRLDPTPRFFTLNALDYPVDIDAPKPVTWLNFLNRLWPDDPDSIATLQEWMGYLLTNDTSQQKMLMLIGPRRAGKGTIARVCRDLLGPQNVCGPTLASLGGPFGLWPLLDKSLAIIADARLSGRSDRAIICEQLLSISGEDCRTIDRKSLEPVSTVLPTRFMLLTNEIPRLTDASGTLASRFIFLRLTRSWFGREDTALTAKLLQELPGILLWSIGGWKRLRERGCFVQPASGQPIATEMQEIGSPVTAFITERCEINPDAEVERSRLYEAYCDWCTERGARVEDAAGFGRDLRAVVPTLRDVQHRIGGTPTRFYGGITLKQGF